MTEGSFSHRDAFQELTMVERTTLDVLENLHETVDDESDREAINRVEALILK